MNLGDIASAQKQSHNVDSIKTGEFPSDKLPNQNSQEPNLKPTAFDKQDEKDSEDADSFDDDKQKSEVLQDLDDAEGEEEELQKTRKSKRRRRK